MLIIPSEVQEHFDAVHEWAQAVGLKKEFDQAMERCDEYGCSEDDPDRCRVILGWDFAPQSFSFVIQGREPDGSYSTWFNGGLIYQGPESPADGGAPSFTVGLHNDIGWFMHT